MNLVTMCFRNITHRKLRTSLCVIGVATATCFIVAVGATTSRYVAIMTEMNMFFRGEIVVVTRNVIVIQGFPVGGVVPQSVIKEIEKLNGVEKAVPMLFNLDFRLGEVSSMMPISAAIGLPIDQWNMIISSTMLRAGGRFPLCNTSDEVVVGCSLADQYGMLTGSKITLKNRELTVCGIVEGPSALLARSIIMSLELAQDVFNYPMQISMAIIKPKPDVAHEELANTIEREIGYVMTLTEQERNELAQPIIEAIENWNMATQVVLMFLSMILVTIVGMISVSERRRDFATLDAIGAPLDYTFRMVVLENSLIGLIGGTLGIVIGSTAALILASLYTNIPLAQFFPSIFDIVPPLYILEIFSSNVLICCIGGILPAINASRMRIAEVLRAEY